MQAIPSTLHNYNYFKAKVSGMTVVDNIIRAVCEMTSTTLMLTSDKNMPRTEYLEVDRGQRQASRHCRFTKSYLVSSPYRHRNV